MPVQLPAPIEHYVAIANSGAYETVADCFAPDATVKDEGKTYEGVAAITNWMDATKKRYGHTIAPLELTARDGKRILKARLSGDFPGSPITVNFNFVLTGGKIRSLEIGS